MKKPRSAGKLKNKIIWALVILIVAVIITPWGRAFYKTLIILPEFIPNSPIKTANFLTKKPIIKEVQFQSYERTIDADLWMPKTPGKHPAAVLHLGVDIDRKDERAQKLANAFSRSGIAILVPNIPSLSSRRILKEGKEDLISSFQYLNSQAGIKQNGIGFVGFCASGTLVLLAAQDPRISDHTQFVVTINPYFDLSSLYKSLTTRQIEDNGHTFTWQPDPKTVEIYNRETINLLGNKGDIEILQKYLVSPDSELLKSGNFQPLSEKEINTFSKEGRFTYDLLTNKDPNKVSYYLENVNTGQKNFLKDTSPSTNIGNLKAKIYILSDKNNIYIPYTEAEALHLALANKDHSFSETKLIPAGNLANNLPLKESLVEFLKIYKFIWSILSQIS